MTTPEPADGTVVARDGTSIATMRRGNGTDALFVHANGFCKELWLPVARLIEDQRKGFGWTAMDLRGQGHSDRSELPYTWSRSALDVADVYRTAGPFRWGVGHSIGGALLARVEAEEPGTFDGLVLIEPVITPPPFERSDHPLALLAGRRRSSFDSRRAARERFARGPFSSWTDESLDLYMDGGFVDTPDGFALRCAPEVEADYFREGSNHDTWELVGSIDLPVLIVFGSESESHSAEIIEAIASRFTRADVTVQVVEGAGHLGPMQVPTSYAAAIAGFMAR